MRGRWGPCRVSHAQGQCGCGCVTDQLWKRVRASTFWPDSPLGYAGQASSYHDHSGITLVGWVWCPRPPTLISPRPLSLCGRIVRVGGSGILFIQHCISCHTRTHSFDFEATPLAVGVLARSRRQPACASSQDRHNTSTVSASLCRHRASCT